MNGPEHYRRAEAQAEAGAQFLDDGRPDLAGQRLMLAQVHATLALAAATANVEPVEKWRQVAK